MEIEKQAEEEIPRAYPSISQVSVQLRWDSELSNFSWHRSSQNWARDLRAGPQ
jgi:hypothetical protein